MKILLIQTAFIGDVILSTPMIAAIKEFHPASTLTVVVKPEARALLEANPAVDEVMVLDKRGAHRGLGGLFAFIREIKNRQFDILLSPHRSHRTGMMAALSRIPDRYGFQKAGFSFKAYNHRLRSYPEVPEIHRMLQFLAQSIAPGAEGFAPWLKLYETEKGKKEQKDLFKSLELTDKPILLAASSVWATKRWTPEGFADLTSRLLDLYDNPIAFIGSKADLDVTNRVMDLLNKRLSEEEKTRIHNLCGATGLEGLFSIMKKSACVISNDSAPVHFAAAARLPVVAIFGPTVPSFGYAPLTPESRIAEVRGLDCRPCGSHGGNRCPEDHFQCMRLLSPSDILKKLDEVFPVGTDGGKKKSGKKNKP